MSIDEEIVELGRQIEALRVERDQWRGQAEEAPDEVFARLAASAETSEQQRSNLKTQVAVLKSDVALWRTRAMQRATDEVYAKHQGALDALRDFDGRRF